METKEQLIKLIRAWIDNDNDIKTVQLELKERRNNKKALTNELLSVMKTNEIDCFDVKNGKLMYTKSTVKQTVSKKVLLTALADYFKDAPEKALEATNHILESRGEKITESIKRKTTK